MLKSVSYSFINPHSHLVTEIDKIWSWGFHVQRTVRWPISPFNTMISLCKPNASLQKFTHKVHGNSLSNWVRGGGFKCTTMVHGVCFRLCVWFHVCVLEFVHESAHLYGRQGKSSCLSESRHKTLVWLLFLLRHLHSSGIWFDIWSQNS